MQDVALTNRTDIAVIVVCVYFRWTTNVISMIWIIEVYIDHAWTWILFLYMDVLSVITYSRMCIKYVHMKVCKLCVMYIYKRRGLYYSGYIYLLRWKPNILEIFTIKFDLESQDRWLSKTDLNWEVSHPWPKCGDPSLDGWLVITQTGSWMIDTSARKCCKFDLENTYNFVAEKRQRGREIRPQYL